MKTEVVCWKKDVMNHHHHSPFQKRGCSSCCCGNRNTTKYHRDRTGLALERERHRHRRAQKAQLLQHQKRWWRAFSARSSRVFLNTSLLSSNLIKSQIQSPWKGEWWEGECAFWLLLPHYSQIHKSLPRIKRRYFHFKGISGYDFSFTIKIICHISLYT